MDSEFRTQTQEVILARMLARTNDSLDKTVDSLVYDASASASVELAQLYIEAERVYNSSFMSKASGSDLVSLAEARGLTRRAATASIILVLMDPVNTPIATGLVLLGTETSFKITSAYTLGDGLYLAQCIETGTVGNVSSGYLTPASYVSGLISCSIQSIISAGTNIESIETLRTRGLGSYGFQPYGGNNKYYREVVGNLDTVGAVKIKHVSAGYVDIYILNNSLEVPDSSIISAVQEEVDPNSSGSGLGLATIGCKVTIKAPSVVAVNVTTNVKTPSKWSASTRSSVLSAVIRTILATHNSSWGANLASDGIILIEAIESALFVAGFEDVSGTTINGVAANLIVDAYSIVTGGTIVGNEIS